MSWIALHNHSQFSILDSAASVDALAARAVESGMPALALTDSGNMYGAVDFFKACKGKKVKPIIGCELRLAPQSRKDKKRIPGFSAGYPIVLLAKNRQGYQNLCRLSSLAHLEGFYYTPRIDKELLAQCAEGLICLSGPHSSSIAQKIVMGQEAALEEEVRWFYTLFGSDFYFELLRHEMTPEQIRQDGMDQESWLYQKHVDYIAEQKKVNAHLLALSEKWGIPCIAANDTRYLDREDWQAHEILMNIQSGEPCEIWEKDSYGNPKARVLNPKREVTFTHELYFKSPEQMAQLFADCPEVVTRTNEIADKCQFEFDFKARYYPVFIPPQLEGQSFTSEERGKAAEQFLKHLCEEGISQRYTPDKLAKVQEKYPGKDPLEVVRERLQYELSVILPKGMGDYLLIVWDFIAWAKKNGIPMGPGRGSGAGSIVLYLIGITDIEPLRFSLFFERFINPERLSYPDIDVDICMDRRSEVIDYTVRKYGKERVAQIITFGTMKAKMAIKDVGRVLSVPLAKVNEIAKLVPEDPNMTLDKALEIDPEFRALCQSDEEVKRLIELAKKLEGSVRNSGIHAAGMIICGDPIMDHIPICHAKDSDMAVTQFSMKPVESVGMLKIDFLGLKTLTAIQYAVDAIRIHRNLTIDWVNLPLDDMSTFDLLNQGKTMGIFQLESPGMQDLARQLHIDRFEEIIAVGALYRPGPMEMIPSFIHRKHGREAIDIDHSLMEETLSETYGIMVYQEQVMQIASTLAGYSLGEGDVLRRAMGKKDREEMSRQREKFRKGAVQNGIDEELALHIFDKIEKFASYGFNKSHAAAYGYLSYVTAYFKANYPYEWMAALMTSDRDDLSKVTKVIRECQAMGIAILPPDINESGKEFLATSKGIRFAMSGIKGVGEGVVELILAERQQGGYSSLYDFVQRIDTGKVGKKVIEHLIEAGCFDFTEWTRPQLLLSVEPMFEVISKEQKEKARGVISLFSLMGDSEKMTFEKPPEIQEPVSRQQILKREYELLGFYLNGHPLDDYRAKMQQLSCVPLREWENLPHGTVCRAAFIIEALSIKISAKRQKKFAILTVSDGMDRFELPIWPDLYESKAALLTENQLLYAVVQLEKQEEELRLQCRWLDDLTQADEAMVRVCDEAFDRAKNQVRLSEIRDRRQEARPKPLSEINSKEAQVTDRSQWVIHIDIDEVKLSHFLLLKQAFRAHAGTMPVLLHLISKGRVVNALQVGAEWGVTLGETLEAKVRRIPSVIDSKKLNAGV